MMYLVTDIVLGLGVCSLFWQCGKRLEVSPIPRRLGWTLCYFLAFYFIMRLVFR